jgi:hypothetical protein
MGGMAGAIIVGCGDTTIGRLKECSGDAETFRPRRAAGKYSRPSQATVYWSAVEDLALRPLSSLASWMLVWVPFLISCAVFYHNEANRHTPYGGPESPRVKLFPPELVQSW